MLVVEDEDMQRMVITMQIRKNYPGVQVDEAENGQVAVDKVTATLSNSCGCANSSYRFIMMDMLMPVKDGLQASKEISAMCKP